MFSQETVPQMFSNIKSIYKFHHDFLLPQLEERMKHWDIDPRIGKFNFSLLWFLWFKKLFGQSVKLDPDNLLLICFR